MSNVQTLFSVDYELFFGSDAGSVDNCLIEPTNALIKVLEKHGARLSIFVDAGYLSKAREFSHHAEVQSDMDKVQKQLSALASAGHDLQLHIHPHWEDCSFDGRAWQIDINRFKLHDFSEPEQLRIAQSYISEVKNLATAEVFAYRAGGWCIQPFNNIKHALSNCGVWLDSTLFRDGISEDQKNGFDFSGMPDRPFWRFSDDPLVCDEEGDFVQLPISAFPLSPLFYWEMALRQRISSDGHQTFGNGFARKSGKSYYLKRLTSTVVSPVSLDGIKARMLDPAFKAYSSGKDSGVFNVMGHPKSLSRYSLARLDEFLTRRGKEMEHVTFQDFKHLDPTAPRQE